VEKKGNIVQMTNRYVTLSTLKNWIKTFKKFWSYCFPNVTDLQLTSDHIHFSPSFKRDNQRFLFSDLTEINLQPKQTTSLGCQ